MGRAISLLPKEIRPFFEAHRAFLVERAIDPDLWRTAGWEEEQPRHFVDLDAYGPYPFWGLPYDYDEAVKRHGRDFVLKNGTLPWRSEEIYKELVGAFQQKSGFSRDNIKFFSAIIGHYAGDAHVPFHAALNYDGQLTQQWGIHSRFEAELFERYRTRLRVTPLPVAPVSRPRDYIFAALISGFPFVQTILDADKKAVDGREVYDDQYFSLMFEGHAADSRAAAGRIDHGGGVDDHRGLDRSGSSGASRPGAAATAAEGASSVTHDATLGIGPSPVDQAFDGSEQDERKQGDPDRDDGEPVLAAAHRHPDRCIHPDHRRRRQALHVEPGPHDGAGAQKADAGHDLRGDPGRITARRPRQVH